MADDIILPMRMQKKTRSASICATGGSIETVIYNLPSGSNTPDTLGTPNYRRRRPATRTQSARMTATSGKQARKRPQQQQQMQQSLQHSRSYCTSEPKLSETETPPQGRKLSQRRPQPNPHPKSNPFLDVPDMYHLRISDDEELDRLRTFSASKGGVINRGDSFRRRRSRSNSLAQLSPIHPRVGALAGFTDDEVNLNNDNEEHQADVYHVEMLGASGVGKQALVSQFRTSDCINAYDGPECDEAEQNISIILNGIESELKFLINTRERKDKLETADAFVVVYSCVDKDSFTRAKQILSRLQDMDLIKTRPVILVANKIDLARSRAISDQDGKCLACTFGAKYIEVSVGINHNCDELLAGILTQIRLRKEQNLLQPKTKKNKKKSKDKTKDNLSSDNNCHNKKYGYDQKEKSLNDKNFEVLDHRDRSPSPPQWYKSRSVMMASMKARQMLTWIFGREDSKFKQCENLQVL